MDIQKIEKVLELIEKTGFIEVEVEQGDLRIRARKSVPSSARQTDRKPVPEEQPVSSKAMIKEGDNQYIVKSPLVGTFYRSPSPGTPPFIEVGDMVKRGQTLCIVEAMKLMNEVEAEVEGKIASIFIENAQPVEYGEPLFLIETNSP